MRAVTWGRDSHGLFDYESRSISKKNLKILNSCKLIRVDDQIEQYAPNTELQTLGDSATTILNLQADESKDYLIQGRYFLDHPT